MTEHSLRQEDENDRLIVVPFRHGPFWNFSYLIACPKTHMAAVIDPAWNVAAILAEANRREFEITNALVTHGHSDHVNGLGELFEVTGARVVVHHAERPGLQAHFGGTVTTIAGEDHIQLGDVNVRILSTAGHSVGSVSFVAGGYVFTGDALNLAGPGTPGPEPRAVEALWEATCALRLLPDATVIHPGHDSGPAPHASIGAEKKTNPAFLSGSFDAFLTAVERATGRRHRD